MDQEERGGCIQRPFGSVVATEKDERVFQLARHSQMVDDPSNLGIHDFDHRCIDLFSYPQIVLVISLVIKSGKRNDDRDSPPFCVD